MSRPRYRPWVHHWPCLAVILSALMLFFCNDVVWANQDSLLETRKSWSQRRLQDFRVRICGLRNARGSLPSSSAADIPNQISTLKANFSDKTARALGLNEFKPTDIKVSGTMLLYKIDGQTFVQSCAGIETRQQPQLSDSDIIQPAATCSSSQTKSLKTLLEAIDYSGPSLINAEVAFTHCPPHLLHKPGGLLGCTNPCPPEAPHFDLGEGTVSFSTSQDGTPNYGPLFVEKNCRPCPAEFPIYSQEKLDCTDEYGCTHNEGHYKTADGKTQCGVGCPRGWIPTGKNLCKEDLDNLCDFCRQAIDEVLRWQFSLESPPSESSQSNGCSSEQKNQVFEYLRSNTLDRLRAGEAQCLNLKRAPRVVSMDQIQFIHVASTPCVGETVLGRSDTDVVDTAKRNFGCTLLPRELSMPSLNQDTFKRFYK